MLHRFRLLPVYLFAACVPLMMRLPLPTLDRLLDVLVRALPSLEVKGRTDVQSRFDSVLFGGYPLPDRRCLTYGLTRYFFLRRAGVPVELVFGLGPDDGKFAGHCWILENGEPLFEGKDPRKIYAPMYVMPGGDASDDILESSGDDG